MATQLFSSHTNEEITQSIANNLPIGRVFASKNFDSSNFRQYLRIFAPEVNRFESAMLEVSREYDINESDVYLENWERAVGIPDECFLSNGTIEERRLHVIIKLACMNVSTEEDMINLASKLGKVITIEPLNTNIYPPYDIPMTPVGLPQAKFIWLVRGDNIAPKSPPYDIPHFLETGAIILNCVLEKTKPAFIRLIFLNPGDPLPVLGSGFDEGFDDGFF